MDAEMKRYQEDDQVWLRSGHLEVMKQRGATLRDVGETYTKLFDSLIAGKGIPKDKFGLWEFVSLTEPKGDH